MRGVEEEAEEVRGDLTPRSPNITPKLHPDVATRRGKRGFVLLWKFSEMQQRDNVPAGCLGDVPPPPARLRPCTLPV